MTKHIDWLSQTEPHVTPANIPAAGLAGANHIQNASWVLSNGGVL